MNIVLCKGPLGNTWFNYLSYQHHVTHLGTHWYSSNIHRVLTGSICCVNLHAGIILG